MANGNSSLRDEVLAADLDRVHLQFGRQDVHHALDAVGGFRPAGAAIGIRGHGVGEDADNIGANVLALVEAGHHQHGERGNGGVSS